MAVAEADPARRRVGLAALAAGAVLVLVVVASFGFRPNPGVTQIPPLLRSPAPSDPRAAFFDGNVTNCAAIGLASAIQVGAEGSASDANVRGTVKANAGTVQPGQGEEVNVTLLAAGVVIDAVVVKGGPAYNVYTDPTFLPPTLPPDQHYISPLNGGGNVPAISHWFVCYHLTTPPALGSLTVDKLVIPPPGPPVTPLPTTFTALVNCNDGDPAHQNVVITFGAGGGRASGSTISGIPAGTVCTVVENSGSFPAGSIVTYNPAGADTTGVTIAANTSVLVKITNDFSGVAVQTGTLALVKTVLPNPPVVPLPASFTAHVECDDGTTTDVTLPGTGGAGTPIVTATAGTVCGFIEDPASVPPGWVVTYTVGNGTPTTTPPVVVILGNTTITVTITNDAERGDHHDDYDVNHDHDIDHHHDHGSDHDHGGIHDDHGGIHDDHGGIHDDHGGIHDDHGSDDYYGQQHDDRANDNDRVNDEFDSADDDSCGGTRDEFPVVR